MWEKVSKMWGRKKVKRKYSFRIVCRRVFYCSQVANTFKTFDAILIINSYSKNLLSPTIDFHPSYHFLFLHFKIFLRMIPIDDCDLSYFICMDHLTSSLQLILKFRSSIKLLLHKWTNYWTNYLNKGHLNDHFFATFDPSNYGK